jgi:hypothetical protein
MKDSQTFLLANDEKLGTCPRCGGNLMLDRDFDGYNKTCLQCSFRISIPILDEAEINSKKKELIIREISRNGEHGYSRIENQVPEVRKGRGN